MKNIFAYILILFCSLNTISIYTYAEDDYSYYAEILVENGILSENENTNQNLESNITYFEIIKLLNSFFMIDEAENPFYNTKKYNYFANIEYYETNLNQYATRNNAIIILNNAFNPTGKNEYYNKLVLELSSNIDYYLTKGE